MKSLSKVIKSSAVKINPPKVVGGEETFVPNRTGEDFNGYDSPPGCETNFVPDNTELPAVSINYDNVRDVETVKAQTSEILLETEQMVKELLGTARREAEKIIKNANNGAENVISEGRVRLKDIEEEAYQRGWQAGSQDGRKHAEEEYQARLQEAQDLLDKAAEERQSIIAGSEDEIVQLAVTVARKIISHELAVNPDTIVDIVKRAIDKTGDREELTVRVNPENLESTINAQEDISLSSKGIRKLKILADSTVAPGGCVVETQSETVDARVERQLSEIEQALMEVGPNA